MKPPRFSLSLSVCVLLLAFWIFMVFNQNRWRDCYVLHWDLACYHLYLPATIGYGDLTGLSFYDSVYVKYQPAKGFTPSKEQPYNSIFKHPVTQKYYIKYTCGVALFQLPFYLLAHLYSLNQSFYPVDGHSPPYQLAVLFSTLFYVFLGLLLLRKWLLAYFTEIAISCALIILAMGTNLYYYTAYEGGQSHVYLFFLYALMLYCTDSWYKKQDYWAMIGIGFALGWATLTRPTDFFLVAIPAFWAIHKGKETLLLWYKNALQILLAICVFSLFLFLQMIYWKITTDHWIFFSYTNEHFDFTNWHIIDGLFSYKRGWFLYTPLALLGFIGMYFAYKNPPTRFYVFPFIGYYLPTLYVIFCWWFWTYGGSFGCRALLQSLALLALPIAALCQYVLSLPKKMPQRAFFFIVFLGISLNIFQTFQYSHDIIHWDLMNKKYYWHVFGQWRDPNDEDRKLLHER
jgi:hypothetical protein